MPDAISSFKQRLVYQSRAPRSVLHRDLTRIKKLDLEQEKLQSTYTWVTVALGVCGFVACVLGLAGDKPIPAAVGAGAVLFVGAVVTGILAWRHSKLNFENRRYELALKVLELISPDVDDATALQMQVDLRETKDKSKVVGRDSRGSWDVVTYRDEWLILVGRLMDGTSFDLTLVEKLVVKSRWKTSASGKMKHKTRLKAATLGMLSLKVKPARYPGLSKLGGDARAAIKLPPGVDIKGLEVAADAMHLSVITDLPWDVGGERKSDLEGEALVGGMFLSLYHVLNLAGLGRKKGAAA